MGEVKILSGAVIPYTENSVIVEIETEKGTSKLIISGIEKPSETAFTVNINPKFKNTIYKEKCDRCEKESIDTECIDVDFSPHVHINDDDFEVTSNTFCKSCADEIRKFMSK